MSLRKKKPVSRHMSLMALPTTSEDCVDGATEALARRTTKKPKRSSWKKLSFAGFHRFSRNSQSSSSDGSTNGSTTTSPTSPISPGVRQDLGKSPPPGYIYYGGTLISRDPESRNFRGASMVAGKAMSLDRSAVSMNRNNLYRQSDMSRTMHDTSFDDEAVFVDEYPMIAGSRHSRVFSDPDDEALFNVMRKGESGSESRGDVVSPRTIELYRSRTMSGGREEPPWCRRRKTGLGYSREQLPVGVTMAAD